MNAKLSPKMIYLKKYFVDFITPISGAMIGMSV